MAEEILVKESLSRDMISAGERLTDLLVDSDLLINAILWLYESESNNWQFIVATPEVSTSGPIGVYKKLRSFLEQRALPKGEIVDWDDIFVVDGNDPTIQLIRQAVHPRNEISGKRVSGNIVNGVLIEDAYIYKLI